MATSLDEAGGCEWTRKGVAITLNQQTLTDNTHCRIVSFPFIAAPILDARAEVVNRRWPRVYCRATPRRAGLTDAEDTLAFQDSAHRLWKKLTPAERLAASTHFWQQPPQELIGTALAAIIQSRKLRPQVARSLPLDSQAHFLATVLDLNESLASSLLVALHLGERRAMLGIFLDAAGLAHENGLLKEEETPRAPLGEAPARAGLKALEAAYSAAAIQTYFNTLWLQDPDQWAILETAQDWIDPQAGSPSAESTKDPAALSAESAGKSSQ
jgi:hypothetical protein